MDLASGLHVTSASPPPDEALLRELSTGGVLSVAGRDRIETAWKARGGLVTDALLELGVCTETQFLRYFAVKYATRFVTAGRLGPTRIPDAVLDKVPVRLAETQGVLPLFWDDAESTLSVAAAVPLTPGRLTAVTRAAGAKHLVFYVVTWAALRAAIRKHYYSDPGAFDELNPAGFGPPPAPEIPGAGEPSPDHPTEKTRVLYASDLDMLLALRQENARFRIAQAFHQRVRPEGELREQLDHVLEVVTDLFASDTAIIRLETGELAAKSRLPDPDVHIPSSLVRKALESEGGLLRTGIPDVAARDTSKSVVARGVKSALDMPLRSADQTLGILYLESLSSPDAFDENDRALLEAVSAQAATVIHNARLLTQARRDAQARANLSRFLPPELVEQAVAGSVDLRLEGQSAVVTVVYADIRGFTEATEALGAAEVVRLLGRFYGEMTQAVFATGGMVDKFMGDGVMAVWGAPLGRGDDAERAVRAAADMVVRAGHLELGGRPLRIGVGVATGEVVVGAIGSERRMDYTVVGPAVNVASRLCDAATPGQVWLTENTRRAAALIGGRTEALGTPHLKGVPDGLAVYRLRTPDEDKGKPPMSPAAPEP